MKSPKVKEAQASGKFSVLFDSGVRTGSDMFRAIALGAQGILCEWRAGEIVFFIEVYCAVGRTYAYGLMLAGQEGVEAVIKTLMGDFELVLGLAGHKSVTDILGKAGEVTIKVE